MPRRLHVSTTCRSSRAASTSAATSPRLRARMARPAAVTSWACTPTSRPTTSSTERPAGTRPDSHCPRSRARRIPASVSRRLDVGLTIRPRPPRPWPPRRPGDPTPPAPTRPPPARRRAPHDVRRSTSSADAADTATARRASTASHQRALSASSPVPRTASVGKSTKIGRSMVGDAAARWPPANSTARGWWSAMAWSRARVRRGPSWARPARGCGLSSDTSRAAGSSSGRASTTMPVGDRPVHRRQHPHREPGRHRRHQPRRPPTIATRPRRLPAHDEQPGHRPRA